MPASGYYELDRLYTLPEDGKRFEQPEIYLNGSTLIRARSLTDSTGSAQTDSTLTYKVLHNNTTKLSGSLTHTSSGTYEATVILTDVAEGEEVVIQVAAVSGSVKGQWEECRTVAKR